MNLSMHSFEVGEERIPSAEDCLGHVVERVDCSDGEMSGAEEDDAGVMEDVYRGSAVDDELSCDCVEDEECSRCCGGGEVLWTDAVEKYEEEEGRELEEGGHDDDEL